MCDGEDMRQGGTMDETPRQILKLQASEGKSTRRVVVLTEIDGPAPELTSSVHNIDHGPGRQRATTHL